jgi:hypothetical protein
MVRGVSAHGLLVGLVVFIIPNWAGIVSFVDLGGICRDTCDDSRPDRQLERPA